MGYYHTDEQGNVSAISDVDRTVVADYDFDAFGNETVSTDSYYNPMRYCGEYYDDETGLIYLRARYYDPYIGRFISEDPHWNLDNMIYGDNQKTVKTIVLDGEATGYDKYNNQVIEQSYLENDLHKKVEFITSKSGIPHVFEFVQTVDNEAVIQSSNLYVYAMNNPVDYIDPSGEGVKDVVKSTINGAITGGIGGAVGGALAGGTATFGTFTLPSAVAGALGGAIAGAASGLAQGLLDEIW